MASFAVVAVLHVHSSVSAKNVACSMFMYIMVLSIFLCPKMYFTRSMSLVLWYSIVPLKCLNVWNDICFSLGLLSFVDVSVLCFPNVVLRLSMSWLNMCSVFLLNLFSMSISLLLIGRILGLLPFSGVMFKVFCCVLRSIHFSIVASPMRIPVSFSVWSSVAVRSPHDAISWSISVSIGMNGSLSSGL